MKKNIEDHIDYIREIYDSIDLKKVSVLTGNNGSGKSLIRKLLTGKVKDELNGKVKSTSMELRTSTNPMWGALSGSMLDSQWSATSYSTYKLLKQCINAAKNDENTKFLVIDEMEIGCSEETILAFIDFVNKELQKLSIGCLIITHSKIVVDKIIFDDFYNLQEMTKEEWLNREIVPTNLEELEKNELFKALQERLKDRD